MILLTWMAFAGPLTEDLQEAWVVQTHDTHGLGRDCTPVESDAGPLPIGLRVEAKLAYSECGDAFAYVRVPEELTANHSKYFHIPTAAISTDPPRRTPWESADPVATLYVRTGSRGYALGQPLGTEASASVPLPHGLAVEVLDPGAAVVRTSWGQAVAVSPRSLVEEDPLTLERDDHERGLRRRFLAGLAGHGPLRALPAADTLAESRADREGAVFLARVRRDDMGPDRAYVPEWLDPVGQLLVRECREPSGDGTPCGAYWLDFTPFGAWWNSENNVDLIVVTDGIEVRNGRRMPRLRVVVRDPFTGDLAVSPAWDGVDPGAP